MKYQISAIEYYQSEVWIIGGLQLSVELFAAAKKQDTLSAVNTCDWIREQ